MKCIFCGAEVSEQENFCTSCGAPVEKQAPAEPVTPPVPVTPPSAPVPPVLPSENRPLSPWAYYGLQLLFSIPLVGFICLIIFSLDNSNINRRNFARSYWCNLIISVALVILIIILLVATGVGAELASEIERLPLY